VLSRWAGAGYMRSLRLCSGHCSRTCEPLGRSASSALSLVLSVLLLIGIGCVGAAPQIVLIPALPNENPEPLTAAEPFKVKVLIFLKDGTVTVSKKAQHFPAGYDITPPLTGDE